MYKYLIVVGFILMSNYVSAQMEVDVADITLKVAGLGNEELYYGFAEGDKIVFNMTEKNGKELKEITIEEYPNTVKYQNRATSKIENKILNVTRKGVYKFSFYNSNVTGRIINVIIKRISQSTEMNNFNTKVVWRNDIDTACRAEKNQYLIISDTSFVEVMNTDAVVHSELNASGNRANLSFVIPQNTVSWAYWIGVGQESKKAYQKDVQSIASAGSKLVMVANPLAGLLLGISPTLTKSNTGENVKYYIITDYENTMKFMAGQQFLQLKNADVITDYGIIKGRVNQKLYIGMFNDNTMREITVNVKVTAMVVKNQYETRTDKVPVITNKRRPFIED
jgi:hypothetical protein